MAKKYDVAKANELVRNTRNSFTVQQQKMILYVVSKIKPNDTKLNYKFSIKEFCKLLEIGSVSGGNYKLIKDSLLEIRNGGFWLETEKALTATAFFHDVKIVKASGVVDIQIHKDLYPYLIELQGNFTKYQLENILKLKSKYSVDLYEYFKSYEHSHRTPEITLTIRVERLKERLNVLESKAYSRTIDFRRKLLDKAILEINRETDITVTYETRRTGRPITHFIFKVQGKDSVDEFMEIPYVVEETLSNHRPEQMDIDDYLSSDTSPELQSVIDKARAKAEEKGE